MRPDGWEKTLREILDRFDVHYMNSEECKLIEAGADAMLEGLKKAGETHHLNCDDSCGHPKGYLVFIPEESDD